MTSTFMRPALLLALALSLSACGGKASFPITGIVTGLSYDGLVLSTNGMDLPVGKSATSFAFPNSLSYGDVYHVLPSHQPDHQTCTVGAFVGPNGEVLSNGNDTAGRLSAINIGVACTLNSYTIGGSISGLTSDGLVLTNGSVGGTVAPLAAATTFTFSNSVAFGSSYGVSVLTQPASETCSVSANGTGLMGDAAVTNIVVSCVKK